MRIRKLCVCRYDQKTDADIKLWEQEARFHLPPLSHRYLYHCLYFLTLFPI